MLYQLDRQSGRFLFLSRFRVHMAYGNDGFEGGWIVALRTLGVAEVIDLKMRQRVSEFDEGFSVRKNRLPIALIDFRDNTARTRSSVNFSLPPMPVLLKNAAEHFPFAAHEIFAFSNPATRSKRRYHNRRPEAANNATINAIIEKKVSSSNQPFASLRSLAVALA